jgi:hypothetical protein
MRAKNKALYSRRRDPMKVAFARPGQAPHNVHMVTLVVPMIVFTMGSILSRSAAASSDVPEHAYIVYGDSWSCERGFKKTRDKCQSIKVPEHAFLTGNSWGDGWKCERGFEKTENECQSIKVPEHAFLTEYGDSWKCERGFKREGDHCSAE